MKGSTLLFLGLAFSGLQAQTWDQQGNVFGSAQTYVNDIDATSPTSAWMVGYSGYTNLYARTGNSGASWQSGSIATVGQGSLANVSAVGPLRAWIAVNDWSVGGDVRMTTDGGLSWTEQNVGQIQYINFVHFFSANFGVTVGDPVNNQWQVFTTTNGGGNWSAANIAAPFADEYAYPNLFAADGNDIYFATSHQRIFFSHDRGNTWSWIWSPRTEVPAFMSLEGSSLVCAFISDEQELLRTDNDGGTWWDISTDIGDGRWIIGLASVPNCSSIVISTRGQDPNDYLQYVSHDNGTNWDVLLEARRISLMDFTSGTEGWAAEDKINFLSTKAFRYQGDDLCEVPCPSTAEITLQERTPFSCTVSWEPVDEATGYEVRCREHFGNDNFGPDQTYFVPASQLSQSFGNLDPLTFYQVRVFTWCGNDVRSFPATRLRVRTLPYQPFLTAEEQDLDVANGLETGHGNLTAWPNPTNGELNISLSSLETDGAILNLYDATGRQVMTRTLAGETTTAFDMSQMPAGIYTLKVNTPEGTQITERISKI